MTIAHENDWKEVERRACEFEGETNTGNLPKWAGAAYAYSKAYKILAKLAQGAKHWHALPSTNSRRSKRAKFTD